MSESIANVIEWLIPWMLWVLALSILLPIIVRVGCIINQYRITWNLLRELLPPGCYPSFRVIIHFHRELRSGFGLKLGSILRMESSEERNRRLDEWGREAFNKLYPKN
jgi:hypothetical protein